jgi:hypothetical protein
MTTGQKLIKDAIAAGATFADFVTEYAKKNTRKDKTMIKKAREQWHREGEVEIDDTTICSGSTGPGDYVLAWVWVDK